MTRIPASIASIFALILASGLASAADLQDMKVLEDDVGTRAILSLQGAANYKIFSLQNPERLVLDLSQARLAPGFRLPAPNGAVANVRAGKPVAGTLRIVFDLGAAMATRSHVEHDGGVTRLIVELSPRERIAALLAAKPEIPAAPPPTIAVSPVSVPPAASPAAAPPAASLAIVQAPVLPAPDPPAALASAAPTPAPVARTASVPAAVSSPAKIPAKTMQDVVGGGQRKLVVAIDAGHGGKDPGAHGPSGVIEKTVTLAVARELARRINADPGMRAVLIRDSDSFVPLKDRYMKARAAQSDLFISIHADASPNNSASGASVFVLSTRGATSQAARWLADQENAADLVGGVSLDEKDHNLAAVLLDLSQSATMRASDDIANQVLGSLKNVGKAHKPAIERANFVVLRSPDVPSMLIETGFITNPSEERRLNDPNYRNRLASATADGVPK
ncbi:MAG: N-acetylmuramoyl-L-alanine amidase [Arenimonas sp.]|nr:N-acetylmuramoyl-L-alanine amidase [Arenimonas sp.]